MKRPGKIFRRLNEARAKAWPTPVVIVLETGKTLRGIIADYEVNIAAIGAPGEAVGGPASLTLRIEVTP